MNGRIIPIAIIMVIVLSTSSSVVADRTIQDPIRKIVDLDNTTMTMDGDPSDWIGIDPILIDPSNDTVSGECKDDILAVYAIHDRKNIYFRIDLGCINETNLYLDLDVDQKISTGYNTNTDPNDWFLQPHDIGFDYTIEIDTSSRYADLYEVDQDGGFRYIESYPVGIFHVIEVGVPLSSIMEVPYPCMNMSLQTYHGGSEDDAPDIGCITYGEIPKVNWTFIVYLDADNNLEGYGIDDLNEMEMIGSTPNYVNIIVLMDRAAEYDTSNGDWTGAKVFYVLKDDDPGIINSAEMMDMGEVNTGDPETLINFVTWAIENYPAENYALVLWDHGSGWGSLVKGICYDDESGDHITSPELKYALAKIREECVGKLDILAFDACLMGMVEVDYQIMPYVDISVASEEVIPGEGYPYDQILSTLTHDPEMVPSELAKGIVDAYMNFYGNDSGVTLAAIDLNGIDILATDINSFAESMISEEWNDIELQRMQVEEFADSDYIDLYHFAELVRENSTDPQVQVIAQEVMDEICNITIAEAHDSLRPNVHGISIYFPVAEYDPDYETDLDFTNDTEWDKFLYWYHIMGPNIWFDPIEMNVTLQPNVIYNTTLTIGNDGNSTLEYCIMTDEYWLNVDPKEGSITPDDQTDINVTINTINLNPGDYNANIIITSNDPDDEVVIPVDLTIS